MEGKSGKASSERKLKKRKHRMELQLSDAEYALLSEAAFECGLPLAAYIRQCAIIQTQKTAQKCSP